MEQIKEIMGKITNGIVYKATLKDGNQVVVKRLREKIEKGYRNFETEINILGKIRHPNLLSLRAYYLRPKGEKLLVFNFMPKGGLPAFLHARAGTGVVETKEGEHENRCVQSWGGDLKDHLDGRQVIILNFNRRLKISLEVA